METTSQLMTGTLPSPATPVCAQQTITVHHTEIGKTFQHFQWGSGQWYAH